MRRIARNLFLEVETQDLWRSLVRRKQRCSDIGDVEKEESQCGESQKGFR